ncbi:response regulator transcription factor [Leifsonia poae]|uniref:response regulator transcription factor n=1 Tax=Leifsonia poae TaxID=110933 RepID=UPI001CC14CD9|nr:response regulator transcription factor [Leifsonia poae]
MPPSDPSRLRIVVADDSVLLREGLVRLFDEAGFETVGAFGDADSLLVRIAELQPDVAVLDVRMPPTFRDEGVRAAIRIRADHPSVAVLLLSQYVEGTYAQELLSAGNGGTGYLLKDRIASLEELKDAVTRVAEGGTVLDPQVVRELLVRRTDPLAALTPRETEVMQLMAEGRTNAGIAQRLTIGVGAVEKNVTAIFQKLGLEDSGDDHRRVLAVLASLQR